VRQLFSSRRARSSTTCYFGPCMLLCYREAYRSLARHAVTSCRLVHGSTTSSEAAAEQEQFTPSARETIYAVTLPCSLLKRERDERQHSAPNRHPRRAVCEIMHDGHWRRVCRAVLTSQFTEAHKEAHKEAHTWRVTQKIR